MTQSLNDVTSSQMQINIKRVFHGAYQSGLKFRNIRKFLITIMKFLEPNKVGYKWRDTAVPGIQVIKL